MKDIRVLIADDESFIRANLRQILERVGYLVIGEAPNGLEALTLTRQLLPDIALIDVEMPGMNGLEVAQKLGAENLAPVILLTNYTTPDLAAKAREFGVLGYLLKPIHESGLGPCLEIVLARWREQQARLQQVAQLQDKIETRQMIEIAKGCLMSSQGLQEAEAFRRIQRIAMNNRKTMREVAQAILLAQQIAS